MSEFSFHKNVSASEGVINFCVMCQNSVFIKMSQLLRGSSIFLSHIWRGWGGGVEKISDETGRGQKNFVAQIADMLPEKTTLTGT